MSTIDTATGAALDALTEVKRPAGMADDYFRKLIKQGFVVVPGPPLTDEEKRQRMSPKMQVYYLEGWVDRAQE